VRLLIPWFHGPTDPLVRLLIPWFHGPTDPLVRLLIPPPDDAVKYDFAIVSAMGVITQGAANTRFYSGNGRWYVRMARIRTHSTSRPVKVAGLRCSTSRRAAPPGMHVRACACSCVCARVCACAHLRACPCMHVRAFDARVRAQGRRGSSSPRRTRGCTHGAACTSCGRTPARSGRSSTTGASTPEYHRLRCAARQCSGRRPRGAAIHSMALVPWRCADDHTLNPDDSYPYPDDSCPDPLVPWRCPARRPHTLNPDDSSPYLD
jgi:hypothetical protein